jgi:predicted outer membrane repeat protein
MDASIKPQRFIVGCLLAGAVICLLLLIPSALARASQTACPPSLQDLIDATPAGGTLSLPACTFAESVTIDKDLTIIGDPSGDTNIQAPPGQRVITFTGPDLLKLQYLTLTDGDAGTSGGGGAVMSLNGSLQISDSRIDGNTAAYGGGIYTDNDAASVAITDTLIENNSATQQGGGIFAKGSLTLFNTDVISNTASSHGGGITVLNGNTLIQGGRFANNVAVTGNGGAVNVNNGLGVVAATFENNSAGDSGGAITQWNPGYPVEIDYSNFKGNSAKTHGGGVFINSVVYFLKDTFEANVVNSGDARRTYGGGIYAGNTGNVTDKSVVTVVGSTFISNTADCPSCPSSSGGGIFVDYAGNDYAAITTISYSSFDGNYAWHGGGVDINNHNLIIDHSTFTHNSAGYGGGISVWHLDGEALIFQGNQVMNSGGGVDAYEVILFQSRFLDNVAGFIGGSAFNANGAASLTNVLMEHNLETSEGTIHLGPGSLGTFNNVTISQPTLGTGTAIYLEGGASYHMVNTIITNYAVGIDVFGTLAEDHNLFYNNTYVYFLEPGGNFNENGGDLYTDPLFVNPAGGDYHLQAASPAIAGGLYTDGIDVDLDYHPRTPARSAMGAYNYWYWGYLPAIMTK